MTVNKKKKRSLLEMSFLSFESFKLGVRVSNCCKVHIKIHASIELISCQLFDFLFTYRKWTWIQLTPATWQPRHCQ